MWRDVELAWSWGVRVGCSGRKKRKDVRVCVCVCV